MDGDEMILVEMVRQESEVLIIAGQQGTLVIHKEFCEIEPAVGDMVTFSTPRVTTMVEGRKVWLGVTQITVEDGEGSGQEQQQDIIIDTGHTQSLLCPCQSLTPTQCGTNIVLRSCPSPLISPIAGLNIFSSVSTSPSPTPGKVSTVKQVVERLGGCSSSPQQVPF